MNGHERELWELEDFSNAYRNWLMVEVDALDYGVLFDILYETEFTWELERDADRAEDGKELRLRFADQSGMEVPDGAMDWPCSLLEMIVALAYSIEELVTYDPRWGDQKSQWFWEMMSNAHLDSMDDEYMFEYGASAYEEVEHICDDILHRKYRPDGSGGLFPLSETDEDQREVPLWFQANSYILERFANVTVL